MKSDNQVCLVSELSEVELKPRILAEHTLSNLLYPDDFPAPGGPKTPIESGLFA